MSVKLSITLEDDLHRRLVERAQIERRSVSFLLARGAELELAMAPMIRDPQRQMGEEMTTAGEAAFAAMQAGAVQKRAELARLLEIADARFEGLGRPPRILEIGSYMGGTLCAWRRMWPDAFVVAVDLPDPPDRPIVTHGAHLIVGDSRNLSTFDSVLDRLRTDNRGHVDTSQPGEVDLLFLDADHDLGSVWRDLELYGRLIMPGGLLAMHDVTPYDEGKSPPLGAEIAWNGLDAWTYGPDKEGGHEVISPVWKRLGAIIDRTPQADGRGAWWGGIGLADRYAGQ